MSYGRAVPLHSSGLKYTWYPSSRQVFTSGGDLVTSLAFNRDAAYKYINLFRKACRSREEARLK